MVGGASRVRDSFNAAMLRARLKNEHDIEISEPLEWGAAHYRSIVSGRAVIEVPGTGMVKRVADAFLWPKARRYDRTRKSDFDDETPSSVIGVRSDQVDLSFFPSFGLDRVVVVAGPGFGKSVLSLALAAQTITRGLLPAVLSIPELSRLDIGIGEYPQDQVNKIHQVAIDWMAAAESGLLVLLLDGLDEVSSARRVIILERIKIFSLRYPATPWLLTVRDAAALAAPTDALLFELEPLDDDAISRFVTFYRPDNPDLPLSLIRCLLPVSTVRRRQVSAGDGVAGRLFTRAILMVEAADVDARRSCAGWGLWLRPSLEQRPVSPA
jgi:predicted NACHT family NTPase